MSVLKSIRINPLRSVLSSALALALASTGGGVGAHLHWRVEITASDGGSFRGIGEMELRGTVGGADLTTPATTINSSSVVNGSNSAANAIDNNAASSGWLSQESTIAEWITVTFPEPVSIAQLSIIGPFNQIGSSPRDFMLLYSDDGVSFTPALSVTNETGWMVGVARLFNIPGA